MSALGQIRSFGDVGSMSGSPESGHGWAIYEYTSWDRIDENVEKWTKMIHERDEEKKEVEEKVVHRGKSWLR
jgi:hypothetical protein